jgi:hypothetical protein
LPPSSGFEAWVIYQPQDARCGVFAKSLPFIPATGITAYLENKATLEEGRQISAPQFLRNDQNG